MVVKTRTRHVVCWLEPNFNLIDVAAFCQVLSLAGSNWNWRPYRLSLVSSNGGLIASRAQVSLDTLALVSAEPPDVVILAGGEANSIPPSDDGPLISWSRDHVFWVALRDGVPRLLQLQQSMSMLAVPAQHQAHIRKLLPAIQFTSADFYLDTHVLSCASLDVLPAALALVERQIGQSARRYVETQMGLTQVGINLQGLDKLTF